MCKTNKLGDLVELEKLYQKNKKEGDLVEFENLYQKNKKEYVTIGAGPWIQKDPGNNLW